MIVQKQTAWTEQSVLTALIATSAYAQQAFQALVAIPVSIIIYFYFKIYITFRFHVYILRRRPLYQLNFRFKKLSIHYHSNRQISQIHV